MPVFSSFPARELGFKMAPMLLMSWSSSWEDVAFEFDGKKKRRKKGRRARGISQPSFQFSRLLHLLHVWSSSLLV